jgi:hypothetical protein
MPINESLIAELQQEAATTKKILECVPMDNPDFGNPTKNRCLWAGSQLT